MPAVLYSGRVFFWSKISMKRSLVFSVLITGILMIATSVSVFAQWPTTCVGLNDIVEAHLGNDSNVGIYQRVYGLAAEEACQSDHTDDVRSVFAWAISDLPIAQTPVERIFNRVIRDWANDQWHVDVIFNRLGGTIWVSQLTSSGDLFSEPEEFALSLYWMACHVDPDDSSTIVHTVRETDRESDQFKEYEATQHEVTQILGPDASPYLISCEELKLLN